MTIILLWTRYLIGFVFGIFAIGMAFAEKNPSAAAACMAIAICLCFSPKFKVREQANVLASDISSKHFFTGPMIFAGIRWTIGFIYAAGSVGGFLQKMNDEAWPLFVMGLIFISPLDRLVFANLRFPENLKARQQSTAIIILRNAAVAIHLGAIGNSFNQDNPTATILLSIAFGLITIVAFITPQRLIVPRPVSPTFNFFSLKNDSQPVVDTGLNTQIQVAEEPPVEEKKVESTDTLIVSEQKFNRWIKHFEKKWLEANRYHHRLSIHRNRDAFNNQVIKELTDLIQQIREREELKQETRAFATGNLSTDYITDLITNTWMGDKQLRSLYNAVVKYSRQPNGKPVWAIAEHIAEYRAMINLVKRIKQSQRADAKKRLAQSHHAAPSLSREQLATLSDETYFKIIDYIILLGKNLENYKELNESFNEEHYRDYFLTPLNTMSPHYAAKGEVFNRKGKTDILIFDTKGNNIFVAECKVWNGTAYLVGGIDQLLNTYVHWRDEKAAIIIFNRSVKKFSELIRTATDALSAHPLCVKPGEKRTDTSWSFWFRHPDDEQRSIRLELILFNFT